MKKNSQHHSILAAGAILILLAVVLLLDNAPGVSPMALKTADLAYVLETGNITMPHCR